MAVRVLSAKVPEGLITELDAAAAAQGITRNRLVRESLEAAVEGRVIALAPSERLARDLRAGVRRDLDALRASLLK